MKKLFTILATVFLTVSVFAQSPQKMSYQAVIRNTSGALVTNQAVGMQISILQGTETGTLAYDEILTPTTNANGLVSVEIGDGIGFEYIDWANGPYFIKTEIDPAGGTNYTISGTSQLISVPYALHAITAENLPVGIQEGEILFWNGSAWVPLAPGFHGAKLMIQNNFPKWQGGDIPSVTNPVTGKIWMDRNLGTSQVANSTTDEAAYGDLYQWGRRADGHQLRKSTVSFTLSDTNFPKHGNFIANPTAPSNWLSTADENLWQGVDGVNNPCPSGYRLPTEAEWLAEGATWSPANNDGAFASPLKLTMAGRRRHIEGAFVKDIGQYWSSTIIDTRAKEMVFRANGIFMDTYYRASGYSIRCIKN